MDTEIEKFLSALANCGGECTAVRLAVPASREQDRARQKARRMGYAEFV